MPANGRREEGQDGGRSWQRDNNGHQQTSVQSEAGLVSQQHGQNAKGRSHARGEMDSMLNRLNGMFLGFESILEKALKTTENRVRLFSELAAPSGNITNWPKEDRAVVQPSDVPPQPTG